jgi:hypothetical protein
MDGAAERAQSRYMDGGGQPILMRLTILPQRTATAAQRILVPTWSSVKPMKCVYNAHHLLL